MTCDKVYDKVPLEENGVLPPKGADPPKGIGIRHLQALILFLSLTTCYSMRAQLSVSIVMMTSEDHSRSKLEALNTTEVDSNTFNIDKHNATLEEADKLWTNDTSWSVNKRYNWNKAVQEMIMFSFFVGYTTMQVPMGILAQRFGGKPTIMVALAANGLLSILTPWMPLIGGWVLVCIGRLVQGLTQAALYPGIHTLLGKWAPITERGRLSTYIYTGSPFGTIIGFQIAGFFAGSPSLGWPVTFWFLGVLALVCLALVASFGASSPEEHRSISKEEVEYIARSGTADAQSNKRKTPWRAMLRSRPVWALIATHIGSGFGFVLVLTQIPLYMYHVLGVDIKNNGLFSSLPYIAMYFTTLFFGYISDYIINKKIMSIKNVRRTFNTIGMAVSAAFLVAFSFVQNTVAAVILLVLSLSTHAGIHAGFNVHQIDLAPNFAGTLMSIGNMLCNLVSLLCPVMVSGIVKDDMTSQGKWQIVFIITGLFQVITNGVFVVFIKDKVQSWNYAEEDEDCNEALSEKLENNIVLLTDKSIKSKENCN